MNLSIPRVIDYASLTEVLVIYQGEQNALILENQKFRDSYAPERTRSWFKDETGHWHERLELMDDDPGGLSVIAETRSPAIMQAR